MDAQGRSRGRGFSGVVRRWSFAGAVSSHGTHEYFRHGGSIGTNMTPGRTLPGREDARPLRRRDGERALNLKIVKLLPEDNLILIEVSVPPRPEEPGGDDPRRREEARRQGDRAGAAADQEEGRLIPAGRRGCSRERAPRRSCLPSVPPCRGSRRTRTSGLTPFTKAAKAQGYPARSVFKLEEIDRRVRLLRPGQRVLDLGAAPGSWSMYAAQRIGAGASCSRWICRRSRRRSARRRRWCRGTRCR